MVEIIDDFLEKGFLPIWKRWVILFKNQTAGEIL
jgi:hypothetical protein